MDREVDCIWTFKDEPIRRVYRYLNHTSQGKNTRDCSISIEGLTTTDMGIYICSTKEGQVTSTPAYLRILEAPTNPPTPPQIVQVLQVNGSDEDSPLTINRKQNLVNLTKFISLLCIATRGCPIQQMQWLLDGERLTTTGELVQDSLRLENSELQQLRNGSTLACEVTYKEFPGHTYNNTVIILDVKNSEDQWETALTHTISVYDTATTVISGLTIAVLTLLFVSMVMIAVSYIRYLRKTPKASAKYSHTDTANTLLPINSNTHFLSSRQSL